jgi:hypothetical protein
MRDPSFTFYKKYKVNPKGILNFFFIEGMKLQPKPSRYGLYKLTWQYAKNAYGLNVSYWTIYFFIQRYKKFQHWLQKDKPVKIFGA